MAGKDGTAGAPAADPERRTHLGDLIRERRAELKESLDKFAQKAVDPEGETRVTRGWIYRLERGDNVTPPVYEELRALAAAAQLPVERIQDAAGAQFHGVDPLRSGSGEATAYVRKLDSVPPEQRERLLRLIDTLVPPQTGDQ
jgi:transcriptional regulator with XRE-family HTH domain